MGCACGTLCPAARIWPRTPESDSDLVWAWAGFGMEVIFPSIDVGTKLGRTYARGSGATTA